MKLETKNEMQVEMKVLNKVNKIFALGREITITRDFNEHVFYADGFSEKILEWWHDDLNDCFYFLTKEGLFKYSKDDAAEKMMSFSDFRMIRRFDAKFLTFLESLKESSNTKIKMGKTTLFKNVTEQKWSRATNSYKYKTDSWSNINEIFMCEVNGIEYWLMFRNEHVVLFEVLDTNYVQLISVWMVKKNLKTSFYVDGLKFNIENCTIVSVEKFNGELPNENLFFKIESDDGKVIKVVPRYCEQRLHEVRVLSYETND